MEEIKVKNEHGRLIDFEAAVALMDDEICEDLHLRLAPCEPEEFFRAYCAAHREKYGEEFEPNKANPVW